MPTDNAAGEVLADVTLRPHLRYRPFGRWQPDPADAA